MCVYVYTGTEHKGCVVGEGNRGEQLSSRLQSEAEPGEAANVGVACMHRRSDDSPAAALPSSSTLAAVDAVDARVASTTETDQPGNQGWDDKTLLFPPLSEAQAEADVLNFENFPIHWRSRGGLHFLQTAVWHCQ